MNIGLRIENIVPKNPQKEARIEMAKGAFLVALDDRKGNCVVYVDSSTVTLAHFRVTVLGRWHYMLLRTVIRLMFLHTTTIPNGTVFDEAGAHFPTTPGTAS